MKNKNKQTTTITTKTGKKAKKKIHPDVHVIRILCQLFRCRESAQITS